VTEKGLISFVIIAYNEAANIAQAIAAIMALDELGEHEIIIVDDGSRDGTAQVVKKIAATSDAVRLIELGANHGRGFARDRGIAEACGEYIATVDADIILPPDWLVRTRSAIESHDAVGGTPVPDGDVAYLYRRFRLAPRLVGNATTVTGNNGLYRRAVFERAGFDATLREGEDVALNHAMKQNGLSIATVPGLLVRHQENKSFGTSLRWLFESGTGATRQLVCYREIRQPDLAAGGFVAAAALGLLAAVRGHRLTAAALPAGFVLAASVRHVQSRFETPVADWRRVAPAVLADSALLTAYFAGRLAGLAALRRRRAAERQRGEAPQGAGSRRPWPRPQPATGAPGRVRSSQPDSRAQHPGSSGRR
jgi:GT2 family glycosyltransferase